MPTSAWILALPMVVLTGAIFAAVCLIGRAVGRGIRRLDRALAKRLPRWTTYLATGVVVVGLGFLVAEDVVVRGLIESSTCDNGDTTRAPIRGW
jgi:hypothetical protein